MLKTKLLPLLVMLTCFGCAKTSCPVHSRNAANSGTVHPADAIEFEKHFYKVFEENLSWTQKKERCEEIGGHLACIESAREQEFIAGIAKGRYLSLGASDASDEGKWCWINGSPWIYTNWMNGQPNNWGGNENYLATYDHGEWVDVGAEGTSFWMPTGYICEWDK